VGFFKEYDALAVKEKFAASTGSELTPRCDGADSETQADCLRKILRYTKSLNASLAVAAKTGELGKPWRRGTRVMKKLEDPRCTARAFSFGRRLPWCRR